MVVRGTSPNTRRAVVPPGRRHRPEGRQARSGAERCRARRSGVDEDGRAQGWGKYGPTDELPILAQHGRAYLKQPSARPDWRIACLYTDKNHRREGIARAALGGAPDLIRESGGGTVESMPEITDGRAAHGRFLFQASVELFEDHGFERVRQLGKWAWLVRRSVLA